MTAAVSSCLRSKTEKKLIGCVGVTRIASVSCLDYVYVSNDATQTISIFSVNRQTGSLSLVTPAVPTIARNRAVYEDVAVTLTRDGRFLIVGMGSSFIPNVLLSFAVNKTSGALRQVSSVTLPVISLPLRLSQLAVAPRNNLLAVSLTSVAGYVALFGIDPATGALTELDLISDNVPFGRAQGLTWSADGSEIYSALVDNRPPSIGGIGLSVQQNATLGLLWTLQSFVSDDSNLIAVDPIDPSMLFFSTQMPAVAIATKPNNPPTYNVSITPAGFVPSILAVEFGATIMFRSTAPGLSVVQVSSALSCLPKAQGFNSGVLVPNQPWSFTFSAAGTYYLADSSRCQLGSRLVVVVGPSTNWTDPSVTVTPIRARATTLDVTFDGENLVTSLQTGGVSIFRVLPNKTLVEVAVATYPAGGLMGTASLSPMPTCCKDDASGPVFSYQPQINVPCNYQIREPFVKLVAGCDWLNSQLVTQGVQLPTCNAQCDALFRISLTDLCGQESVATQYIRHDPDVEPPIVTGGLIQTIQCVLNSTFAGNSSRLQLFDQCQPVSSLIVSQSLGNITYSSPLQCRVDKVVAVRNVTWTVTDSCSNAVSSPGQVTSIDTLGPELSIADYIVPCPLGGNGGVY